MVVEPPEGAPPEPPEDRAEDEAEPGEPAEPEEGETSSAPGVRGEAAEGATPPGAARAGPVLRGAVVAPGLATGTAHLKGYELDRIHSERVSLDEVDRELNRFRSALDHSRLQLQDLRTRLSGRVQEEDARILDTHLAYLKDSVFLADVENLILNEQMRLEAAIAKVIADFDRIFRLVQNDAIKQSAVDLRDVGIRVLRNLEREEPAPGPGDAPDPPHDYILVARELSIVDMFNLANEHVLGIATREGAVTSHAAIFARSMRIPTITGVERILDEVREGDYLILDATEGVLRVNPDDRVRAQYAPRAEAASSPASAPREAASGGPASTRDGTEVELTASCGSLPEVEEAAREGLSAVGLYRTELLYLVDRKQPSREELVHHYTAVIAAARDASVTFRLLNADSSLGVAYLHERREPNPALGRVGVRALLANEGVLRRQLQAILVAGAGARTSIAVPGVSDCGELRRVREVLFEERFELRKAGEPHAESASVGVVLETPASMLGVRDLAAEADFLLVNLDSLQQYLLAADRETPEMAPVFEVLHPFVLRALEKVARVAAEVPRDLAVFGVSASGPENLPLLLGAGVRSLCVAPAGLADVVQALAAIDLSSAERASRRVREGSAAGESSSLVAGFRHGYARP